MQSIFHPKKPSKIQPVVDVTRDLVWVQFGLATVWGDMDSQVTIKCFVEIANFLQCFTTSPLAFVPVFTNVCCYTCLMSVVDPNVTNLPGPT